MVYLWDRDASTTLLAEKIDWGAESLEMIEEMDGAIVGLSVFANTSTEAHVLSPKLVFKAYTGVVDRARRVLELPLTSAIINGSDIHDANTPAGVAVDKQKINNRVLFILSAELLGNRVDAIWAIHRRNDGSFGVSIDRLINNDTGLTSGKPKGFLQFGDYVTAGFNDNGTYKTTQTTTTYTNQTAKFETVIFGKAQNRYKLRAVGVMTEPLASGESVSVGYKKDEETSFTSVLTHSTVNDLFKETMEIESDGTTLPKFRELEFQVTSTGGATITGFWFQVVNEETGQVKRISVAL